VICTTDLRGGYMKKGDGILFLIIICLIFLGCAKVKFTPTGKTYPPYQGAVKIYTEPPAGMKFEEIGWVSAEGDFNHPWVELLQMMQQQAASKGANALIIQERFTTKVDADVNVGRGLQDDRSVTAIAVKILE
jgi:hypothetical protein